MKKNFKSISLFIFLSFFITSKAIAEIKFKEVVVTGVGQSLEEATNNAIRLCAQSVAKQMVQKLNAKGIK
jgi:hypothetical protein